MADKQPNFKQKLFNVVHELETLTKNGEVAFGKTKYSYLSEAELVKFLKPLFKEHRINFEVGLDKERDRQPEKSSVELHGDLTLVYIKVILEDIDSDSKKEYYWCGSGKDSGDKGIYKAYTGAVKTCLMKNILVSTGDDPETVQEFASDNKSTNSGIEGFSRRRG